MADIMKEFVVIFFLVMVIIGGCMTLWQVTLARDSMERRPSRQFTLGGLMGYIFLWAVCLSQLSFFEHFNDSQTEWRTDWVVVFAWIVMLAYYVWRRHIAAIFGHCIPLIIICLCMCILILNKSKLENRYMLRAMALGSFTGLIFFSILGLRNMLAKPPAEKQDQSSTIGDGKNTE
jgi:hypothetical protein